MTAFRAFVASGILAAVPGIALAHAGIDDPDAVHACVNHTTGAVRIVGVTGACRVSETPMHWQIVGPQGPQGPTGLVGLANVACPSGQSVTGFDASGLPLCTGGSGGGTGGGGVPDLDGDGIPDDLDPCNAAFSPPVNGVVYCPISPSDSGRPIGMAVVTGEVIVHSVNDATGEMTVKDWTDMSGSVLLRVKLGTIARPTVNSRIMIYGVLEEDAAGGYVRVDFLVFLGEG